MKSQPKSHVLRPQKKIPRMVGMMALEASPCLLTVPCGSVCLMSASPKRLSPCKANASKIRVNRMAAWQEGNIENNSGGGSVYRRATGWTAGVRFLVRARY
jgi:hypothetical protein